MLPDGRDLIFNKGDGLPGDEPLPIQVQSVDTRFGSCAGGFDLVKAVVDVTPEGGPVGLVQFPNIAVELFFQILPEGLLA